MKEFFKKFGFVKIVYEVIENEIYFKSISENFYEVESVDKKTKVIGEKLIDIFPGVKDFGIYDKIIKVFNEDLSLTHEVREYSDEERYDQWRFNYIYKQNRNVYVIYHNEKYISELGKHLFDDYKKKKEDIISKSNELNMIIDNMNRSFALHEMIFDEDKPIDYKFLRINKAFEKATGLNTDIVGKTAKYIFGKDSNFWISKYGDIFTKNKTLHFERYFEPLDKWFLIDAYHQQENKFVTIFEDITSWKTQNKRNEDIINSTLSASFLTDKDGKVILANDRGCKFFNLCRGSIVGKKMNDLYPKHIAENKRKKELEVIFTNTPSYYVDEWNGSFYQNYIYPILNEYESITYLAIHIKDITEQETNKIELEKAKISAEKSDLLKSLFLANMSHEIRTPMNSILGFSDLLLDSGLDDVHKEKFLKTINANTKHLSELLNNVLDYAKIEAGEMDILYESFTINDLFDELDDLFSNSNMSKNLDLVELIFEMRDDSNIIISDYLRLKQILYNLLSNAIKFTDSGIIRVGSIIKDNIVTFFVEDTGIGIPNNKLEFVFDRFTQVDESSKKEHQGTGLGLSICKSLVEILGGNIWVDSTEKVGSTFFFTIPLETIIPKQTIPKILDYDFSNLKVLVIEDIPENFSLLGLMLKSMQVKMTWLNSIKIALDIIKKEKHRFIFLDMSISNININNFLEKIKQIDNNITIITISVEEGDDDFHIVKPITREKISKILKKLNGG